MSFNHPSTLMLGTSAGLKDVHDPSALPLDTLTYLYRADDARAERHARGLFFVFDSRPEGDVSDAHHITARTEHFRALLGKFLPHCTLLTHSELETRGFASVLSEVDTFAHIPDPQRRAYTRLQIAQNVQMRRSAPGPFTKFGWILDRRSQGRPVGGEANFDAFLPPELGIELAYTAPGFPLDSRNGKAPYLLHHNDRSVRVCLPTHRDHIAAEVEKIRPGVSRLMHRTTSATADRMLGQAGDLNGELAHVPVLASLKEAVTDERAVCDLREKLSAAFCLLLS